MSDIFDSCDLCPRNCRVNRNKGEVGFCRVSSDITVSRASLHFWEEPCISGKNGSGTVFFSGCQLGCVYCQNIEISRGKIGKKISEARLSEIFIDLQNQGANNINLVTPTHFVPKIISAIKLSKNAGLKIPIVYNTSSYENINTLKMLNGFVDIYLPDFKYFSGAIAKKYSFAKDYPEAAKNALYEMVSQAGTPKFDKNGIMKSGVIVRHLLLPGYIEDSKKVLKYLYDTYKNAVYISIMSQFTPMKALDNYPEINRKVTEKEYDELINYAIAIGIENAFIQEGEAASESFIPSFDLTGL